MPTIGLEGGRINIVPVDFVVKALDHIAHLPRQDGKCFHLTDPKPRRIGEVLNIFADAAHCTPDEHAYRRQAVQLHPGRDQARLIHAAAHQENSEPHNE